MATETTTLDAPHKTGWLAARQQAWDTAPGTPPRGPAPANLGGWWGDKKFSLLFPAAVLLIAALFIGYIAYSEATAEFHSPETGEVSTGGGFGNESEPTGVGD